MQWLKNLFGKQADSDNSNPAKRTAAQTGHNSPLWVADFNEGWSEPQLVNGSYESCSLSLRFFQAAMDDDVYAVARLDLEYLRKNGQLDDPSAITLLILGSQSATSAGDSITGLRWARKVCDIVQLHALGTAHLDAAYLQVANSFRVSGDYENTVANYEQALVYLKKNLGDDHPRVGETINFIAGLTKETVAALAHENDEMGSARGQLAEARRNGKTDQIEFISGQILERSHWAHGPNHVQTAAAYFDSAESKYANGHYFAALDAFRHYADLSIMHTGEGSEQSRSAIKRIKECKNKLEQIGNGKSSSPSPTITVARSALHLAVFDWTALEA